MYWINQIIALNIDSIIKLNNYIRIYKEYQ